MKKNVTVICFILTTVLLCGHQTSYGQYANEDESNDLIYTVEVMPGDAVRLIPDHGADILTADISKKVDLNFDGLDDLIVMFPETYGNWGDCVYGIYAQKENGKYVCVFQEYWFSYQWDLLENECNLVDGVRWMKLRLYSRTDYGGGPPGWIPTHFLQFDGKRYQEIGLQSLTNWPQHIDKTETFGVEKEYQYQGKTYQVGRMLLKDFTYGPLTLRIMEHDNITDICAPMDENPDLETSQTRLVQLRNRPFFLVKDRYHAYLIDLEQERIFPIIMPGRGVNYGDDAISKTIGGFHFFDNDQYLLGAAVNYGPFCFNISDLDHPVELKRYSSQSSDYGQPYFFLEQNADGTYNGLISQSDKTEKSSFESVFYSEEIEANYLFQKAHLATPEDIYADPADYEIGHPEPYLLLHEKVYTKQGNIQEIDLKPWVIDLKKGVLLKGKQAKQFIKKQK